MDTTDIPWEPHPKEFEIRLSGATAIMCILSWEDILWDHQKWFLKYVLLWDLIEED